MKKKIIGIFVCILLVIPATISASSSQINDENGLDINDKIYVLGFIFGRISNLKEELLYDEMHYTFEYKSIYGIQIIYIPLFEVHFEPLIEFEGRGYIPKENFRGFINNNLIVGFVLVIHND